MTFDRLEKMPKHGDIIVVDLLQEEYIGRYNNGSHALEGCVRVGSHKLYTFGNASGSWVRWAERLEALTPQPFGDLEGRGDAKVFVVDPAVEASFRSRFSNPLLELLSSTEVSQDPDAVYARYEEGGKIPWARMTEDCLVALASELRLNHGQITYLKFCIFESD